MNESVLWWKVAMHLDEAQLALTNAMALNVDDPTRIYALQEKLRSSQALLLDIFRTKGLAPGDPTPLATPLSTPDPQPDHAPGDPTPLSTPDPQPDLAPSDPTPLSTSELLAKESLIHPPTGAHEVLRRYETLMAKFSNNHNLHSPSKIDEAIRSHRFSDHALLEEWITVRAAMDALGVEVPPTPEPTPDPLSMPDVQPATQAEVVQSLAADERTSAPDETAAQVDAVTPTLALVEDEAAPTTEVSE